MCRSVSRNNKHFLLAVIIFFTSFVLVACSTARLAGPVDYSDGINAAVEATETMPSFRITDTAKVENGGYLYLLERAKGRWRIVTHSTNIKNLNYVFEKDGVLEVGNNKEVLWTDGHRVVPFFGSVELSYRKEDGSFSCPRDRPGHRACRSKFAKRLDTYYRLPENDSQRPFVLDFEEIIQAVAETGILQEARKQTELGQ